MKDVFTEIYLDKIWYGGSGSGSSPKNTVEYRVFLQKYLIENNITSVVDLGCGDWQFSKLIDWSGIKYIGVDVVEFLIRNNIRYFSNRNIFFKCIDGVEKLLPKADLLIIKDVFQHWSNKNINKFLARIKNRYNFILITNTGEGENLNKDIINGEMRPVDLSKAPFNKKTKVFLRYKCARQISGIMETKIVAELN